MLTKAVEALARSGESGIVSFADFLAKLPEGVSKIASGQKIAGELADLLQAEMDIDPLLRDGHAIADSVGLPRQTGSQVQAGWNP